MRIYALVESLNKFITAKLSMAVCGYQLYYTFRAGSRAHICESRRARVYINFNAGYYVMNFITLL